MLFREHLATPPNIKKKLLQAVRLDGCVSLDTTILSLPRRLFYLWHVRTEYVRAFVFFPFFFGADMYNGEPAILADILMPVLDYDELCFCFAVLFHVGG